MEHLLLLTTKIYNVIIMCCCAYRFIFSYTMQVISLFILFCITKMQMFITDFNKYVAQKMHYKL